MKIKIILLLTISLFSNVFLKSQEQDILSENIFEQSYGYINGMLKDEIPLNFKDAVLQTEIAFNNELFDIEKVNQKYRLLVHLAKEFAKSELITYSGKDKDIIVKHAAIFKAMSDTTLIPVDSSHFYVHTPYMYDFDDPLGQRDWSQMFVCKLLETGKGNCHSLPYLYKILAEELDLPCNYISPQINRAVKNKSYFYNCYGKEEKFYIENQG